MPGNLKIKIINLGISFQLDFQYSNWIVIDFNKNKIVVVQLTLKLSSICPKSIQFSSITTFPNLINNILKHNIFVT